MGVIGRGGGSSPLAVEMDVTSLLNSGAAAAAAAAAEQQRRMESTRSTPTRSRTPWDAGGYSLPINTAPTALQSISAHANQCDEAKRTENQTPISPKHKLSDSRSSFSSFTSSLQSATHSRYSSMSTVNSIHPSSGFPMDSLSPKSRNPPHVLELATIDSISENRHSTSLSPTGSLDTLAMVAETHLSSRPRTQGSSDKPASGVLEGGSNQLLVEGLCQSRPSSPSDAVLIKRAAIPVLRVNTGDIDLKRTEAVEV